MAENDEQQGLGAARSVGDWIARYADWVMGVGVLGLMVTLVTPIPPVMLDMLLTVNITMSLLMLLVTMNVRRPSELSTFPTILLFGTLFRLGLNVASTRLILSGGDAGTIIHAFGRYVVGDDLTVGLVVFLILIIIQFVVITKGSGRISEVAARFVLDAMPGKQMAIDADLNAGLIDADQARTRRARVAGEAEFYGAMDGASKFVRGDAIAGLIITALNLLGGVAIGSMGGLSVAQATQRYSMLTIGDGLVSQVPALLVSTAAAVLVTKSSSSQSLGANLMAQAGGRPKATMIAAGMLFALGLLPGMPATPFFILATALLAVWRVTRGADGPSTLFTEGDEAQDAARAAQDAEASEPDEVEQVKQLLQVDRMSLEIGYRLIPLVQDKQGTGILDHIAQLRRKFASSEGVLLPPVRIKDNIRLEPNGYRVLLGGQEIARGETKPSMLMAMDGGSATGPIKGRETVDPAFGLPARWIQPGARNEAELLGYTVIDPTSVLITHLSETLRGAFGEILNRDDVKELIESARESAPAVVEELVPDRMGYGEVQTVLRQLLRDGVPIRNMPVILETLADNIGKTKDPDALTELVRQRMGRVLCEMHADREGVVHAVTIEPEIEARLASAMGAGRGAGGDTDEPVSPVYLQRLMERIADSLSVASRSGKDVVVLARANVRRFLHELVRATLPRIPVLSYNEVVEARSIETAATVSMED